MTNSLTPELEALRYIQYEARDRIGLRAAAVAGSRGVKQDFASSRRPVSRRSTVLLCYEHRRCP